MTTIIAEVGSSHGGTLDSALEMVKLAANAGADIVKFQLFTGDDLWHPSDKRNRATKDVALPREWIKPLMNECFEYHVSFLCTPFSLESVDFLESLGVQSYKVASGDITYIPLLERIAKTSRLVYLSVGASDFREIDRAVEILKDNPLIMLHCVPEYPSLPETANISRIMDLTERYYLKAKRGREIMIGLSSHLREWWVDVACVAYKVFVIEKHLAKSIDGIRQGPEAPHSLDPLEFALFVEAVRDVEKALVKRKGFTDGEEYARNHYRRNESDWLRPYKR